MELQQPIANYNGKPEIDDGHTKIANELLEALAVYDFTKRQLAILLFIIRKTYGWNKSQDDISRSQIVEGTGFHNPHITNAIQELQADNVLIVGNGKHAKSYKINKYYDQWRVTKRVIITKTVNVTETVTITETVTDSYQNSNIPLLKQYPQKTTPKDNTKDICIECLNYLNEKAKRNYKPVRANLDFIKARLNEGFTKDDVINVINVKASQWLNDVAMNKYLRPATLFNASKFAQYSAETIAKSEVPNWQKGMLMTINVLLNKLQKVKRTGDGKYMACCPAHQDKTASLVITLSDDNRILINCFAGCDTYSILRSVGLDWDAVMPEKYTGETRKPVKPIIYATEGMQLIRFEAQIITYCAFKLKSNATLSTDDLKRLETAMQRINKAMELCDVK